MHKNDNLEYNNLIGISYMIINAFAIAVIYVFIKELTKEVSSSLVVFLYKFMILISILPWCFYGGLAAMKTKRLSLHMARGFLSASGSLCLFYAIKYIDVADITAVGYLEQILWAIIGMAIFGEKLTGNKVLSIVLSFCGALLVLYPDLIELDARYVPKILLKFPSEFNRYYIFVFCAIIFWATNCTIVKILGKTEKAKVQLFYGLIFQLILAAPFAFCSWQEASFMGVAVKQPIGMIDFYNTGLKFSHLSFLILLAICYFAHSIAFFLALKNTEVSLVVPFDYSRILFAAILGYAFFSEIPAKEKLIGYFLIAGSGIYLVCAEARYKKRLQKAKIQQLEQEFEHA
jgi:S-adenosylmethionine uptake transporter